MVDLIAARDGDKVFVDYLPELHLGSRAAEMNHVQLLCRPHRRPPIDRIDKRVEAIAEILAGWQANRV